MMFTQYVALVLDVISCSLMHCKVHFQEMQNVGLPLWSV